MSETESMLIAAMIQQTKGAVLCLQSDSGVGTGFVMSQQGHILTCNHALPQNEVTAVSAKGDRWTVPVLARDPAIDLALLQIPEFTAPALRLADPTLLHEGQTVFALGHPMGLNFTISRGVISSRERIQNGVSYLQTDVSLNPGNSGGPIVNESGEVVGVAIAILADSQRIGFAISLRHIFAFAAQLRVPLQRRFQFQITEF